MVEERVRELERQVEDLSARVGLIDGGRPRMLSEPRPAVRRREPARRPAPAPAAQRPATPTTPPSPPPPAPPRADRSLEDLLGGRVLAWVGGAAVLLALVLLFALGVSSGAIDETGRTLIGGGVAALLLGGGLYAHRRHGRTHASLALVGTGVAGLFLTVTVATSVYDLLPAVLGVAAATALGAWATWLAIRWQAQVIGWLGTLGAVAAPLLGGALVSYEPWGPGVVLLFVATACASAVVVAQRWDRLALAVFLVSTLQWFAYAMWAPSGWTIAATLTGFGALGLATAIGRELRMREPAPAPSRLALVAANALAVAGIGHLAFSEAGLDVQASALLVVLAAVHAGVGVWGLRSGRIAHPLALLTLTLGVLFADLAFADLTSGLLRGVGFMAAAGGFALLARHPAKRTADDVLVGAGLGGHIAIALAQVLALAPAEAMIARDLGATGLVALAALAAACLGSGVLLREARPVWADLANAVGLVVVLVLTLTALSGVALVAALCAEAIALSRYAARDARDVVALQASIVSLIVAGIAAAAFAFQADTLPVLAAVALVTAACGWVARSARNHELRRVLIVATGLSGLALVSLAATGLPITGDADQGQLQLTAAWALLGVAGLVVGLRRDLRPLRLAALGLIGIAAGKAFLFDLATLAPAQRIGSLLGLGLLLLGGAFVYQRLRPEPPADLRSVPSALR